jgi:hypothetical protein
MRKSHIKLKESIMQITINIPDNLPSAIVQQELSEFEAKLNRLMQDNKTQKQQAIIQIIKNCASLPTIDHRSADEVLGYTDNDMGLWGD